MEHGILSHHRQGLDALARGDYATAATSIRSALTQLQEHDDIDSQFEGSALVLTLHHPPTTEDSPPPVMESRAVVFTGVFRIRQVNADSTVLFFDKALLATNILYHLGLAFQLWGLSCRQRRSVSHRHAVSIYTLAMATWNEIKSPDTTCGVNTLALAIGNNLACLHAECQDHTKVDACVTWFMARTTDQGLRAAAWLLTNIHMWQAAKMHPAASA
jgi:hypothetical protein